MTYLCLAIKLSCTVKNHISVYNTRLFDDYNKMALYQDSCQILDHAKLRGNMSPCRLGMNFFTHLQLG